MSDEPIPPAKKASPYAAPLGGGIATVIAGAAQALEPGVLRTVLSVAAPGLAVGLAKVADWALEWYAGVRSERALQREVQKARDAIDAELQRPSLTPERRTELEKKMASLGDDLIDGRIHRVRQRLGLAPAKKTAASRRDKRRPDPDERSSN